MIPIKDIKESNIDSCISGGVACTEHPEKFERFMIIFTGFAVRLLTYNTP
jgi:hypothetical protein